jgi:DNA (cytosine-5)-methyltransferase 1
MQGLKSREVNQVNMLDLFSGFCGFSLAADWAGIKTTAFCEIEPYPQRVIKKNYPGIPIFEDVRDINKQSLTERGVIGNGRTIELVSAGYPCQGESNVGKRKGAKDDRWLWPETARILEEIAPDWFIGENVSGHITMGLDTVLDDLGGLNYTAQAFHIPAIGVDGDHERYRVFIVAYSDKKSGLQTHQEVSAFRKEWDARKDAGWSNWNPIPRSNWNLSGPPVSRSIDGIPNRLERCYGLGNAVSPHQVYPFMKYIKQINDLIGSKSA